MLDIEKPEFDTTPEIRYDSSGKAIQVTTYCVVNSRTRSFFETKLRPDGSYVDSCFDEYHGISWSDKPVSRERLKQLDTCNPHRIPILDVLGKTHSEVKVVLKGRNNGKDIVARHIK